MTISEIVAMTLSIMTGIGLIVTWIKSSQKDNNLKTELEVNLKADIRDIKGEINHPEYGLAVIRKAQQDQVLYCIRTSEPIIAKNRELESRIGRVENRISGI